MERGRAVGVGTNLEWLSHRGRFASLLYVGITSFVTVQAVAAPITSLFGTGLSGMGDPLPDEAVDPHYQLTMSADPTHSGPRAFVVIDDDWPIGGPWIANSDDAQWIAPRADGDAISFPGQYVYRTTFDLTGFDPNTAEVAGQWATDDLGTDIVINGVSTGQSSNGFATAASFSITSGFVEGINTIDFLLTNSGSVDSPTGLYVIIQGTAEVPEPATLSCLLVGALIGGRIRGPHNVTAGPRRRVG